MIRTHDQKRERKEKKSYTLSSESVAFLESVRKTRRASSASSVLEEILQAVRREQERSAIERDVVDYYASLSDAELEDRAAWGEFALHNFPQAGR